MAVKLPLVMGPAGFPEQLQSGDSIAAVETGQVTLQFTSNAVPGNVVYPDGAGTVDLARANATGTSKALGLSTGTVSAASSGQVQVNGIVTLTTAEWDAVAGTTGGLTAGTYYFLSTATAGHMTSTPPSTVGQTVQKIGQAISTTSMNVMISDPILL